MSKDPFHLTKTDVKNKDLTTFLDIAAKRMDEVHPSWQCYDRTTGVLND